VTTCAGLRKEVVMSIGLLLQAQESKRGSDKKMSTRSNEVQAIRGRLSLVVVCAGICVIEAQGGGMVVLQSAILEASRRELVATSDVA
jgi:hypothetical protein